MSVLVSSKPTKYHGDVQWLDYKWNVLAAGPRLQGKRSPSCENICPLWFNNDIWENGDRLTPQEGDLLFQWVNIISFPLSKASLNGWEGRSTTVSLKVTITHTLITWPLASEWTLLYATPQYVGILLILYVIQVMWPFDVWKYFQLSMLECLICHPTMCRNAIIFLYDPGHMTNWCLEVVPVVYARVTNNQTWMVHTSPKSTWLSWWQIISSQSTFSSHNNTQIVVRT